MRNIFIGFDPREADAYAVALRSIERYNRYIPVRGIWLDQVRRAGLYYRPTEVVDGKLFDTISEHPMSTEFAISRFLTPILSVGEGWSLFTDCDVFARDNVGSLFSKLEEYSNRKYAVMCVKHDHVATTSVKMDNQVQSNYRRKNWSSVMAFNLAHPSNKKLTVDLINTVPGRDLHRFCWLQDEEIGAIDPAWNYLVGETEGVDDPKIVHFTNGTPSMHGYENSEYGDEWRSILEEAFVLGHRVNGHR